MNEPSSRTAADVALALNKEALAEVQRDLPPALRYELHGLFVTVLAQSTPPEVWREKLLEARAELNDILGRLR